MSGWTLPAASAARQRSSCSPGSASHEKRHPRQAHSPACSSSVRRLPVAAVHADLDPLDRCPPRPGAALERTGPRPKEAGAREEVRDPGRDHQRARLDPRHRLALLVLGLPQPVGDVLLPAAEGLVDDGDRPQPLDVRHPVPARDDEPERVAVLRRQRLAVDRPGEQHLVAQRLRDREAALVVLDDAALDAAVEPGEDDLERVLARPRLPRAAARAACPSTPPCRRPRSATAGSAPAARAARGRSRRTRASREASAAAAPAAPPGSARAAARPCRRARAATRPRRPRGCRSG